MHLLQDADISSEMLAPCYRSYSPEGSVRNCTRIEQYTQKGNIEVHSCNKFAAEKQKNITYCVCVCVCVRACVCVCVCSFSYPACKAHALYSIVICGPYGSTKFFHILLKKGTIFEKKKVTEHNMCFGFVYNFCPKYLSFKEEFSEIQGGPKVGIQYILYTVYLLLANLV